MDGLPGYDAWKTQGPEDEDPCEDCICAAEGSPDFSDDCECDCHVEASEDDLDANEADHQRDLRDDR